MPTWNPSLWIHFRIINWRYLSDDGVNQVKLVLSTSMNLNESQYIIYRIKMRIYISICILTLLLRFKIKSVWSFSRFNLFESEKVEKFSRILCSKLLFILKFDIPNSSPNLYTFTITDTLSGGSRASFWRKIKYFSSYQAFFRKPKNLEKNYIFSQNDPFFAGGGIISSFRPRSAIKYSFLRDGKEKLKVL